MNKLKVFDSVVFLVQSFCHLLTTTAFLHYILLFFIPLRFTKWLIKYSNDIIHPFFHHNIVRIQRALMMRLKQFFFEWLLSVNVYTLSRKITAFKALEAFIVVLYCIHKKHVVEKIYYTEVFP